MRHVAVILTSVVLIAGLTLPLFQNPYLMAHVGRILVFAIFAMSLDLLIGYCGLVSLGHAAFFGVAAYATALLSVKFHIVNIVVALPASVVAAAVAAVVIGLLTLRTKGIYFIMATLAFAQMLYFLVSDSDLFGGSDGILVRDHFRLNAGFASFDMSNRNNVFVAALIAALLTFLGLFFLVRSPFGRILQGIKSNERRMRALGYPVNHYKLACFVIGGAIAGLAGHLYVLLTSLADPSILDWLQSAQVLMMVIIGGLGTLVGAALGSALLIELIDQSAELTEHWRLIVGAAIVVVTLFWKGGLAGLGATLLARPIGAKKIS